MTDDELEILRGMWAECADDLDRWARAFAKLDPGSEYIIRVVEQLVLDRLAQAKTPPKV